jgi:hypothetical protein
VLGPESKPQYCKKIKIKINDLSVNIIIYIYKTPRTLQKATIPIGV